MKDPRYFALGRGGRGVEGELGLDSKPQKGAQKEQSQELSGVTARDKETGNVEWILRSWHLFPLRRSPIREARCCRRWRRRMKVSLERAMRTL